MARPGAARLVLVLALATAVGAGAGMALSRLSTADVLLWAGRQSGLDEALPGLLALAAVDDADEPVAPAVVEAGPRGRARRRTPAPRVPGCPSLEGIDPQGGGRWNVSRATAERVLRSGCWVRQARAWRELRPDGTVGVRLGGIGNPSLFAHLGLADGDLLLRVNGHPLGTTGQGLTALAAVRSAREILVDLERLGSPRRLRYRLTR